VINELGKVVTLVDRSLLQAGWLAVALMALSVLGALVREVARRKTYRELLENTRPNTMLVDVRSTGGCLVLICLPESPAPESIATVAVRLGRAGSG
jgi:hypothetical protein